MLDTTPLNGLGEPITRRQGDPVTYPYTPPPLRGDGELLGGELDLDEETPEIAPSNEPSLHEALAVCHKELLTQQEAAQYAGAGTNTIRHWIDYAGLETIRFGQHAYVSREGLRELLATKGRKPKGEK